MIQKEHAPLNDDTLLKSSTPALQNPVSKTSRTRMDSRCKSA